LLSLKFCLLTGLLTGAANFVGANAAGANRNGFMLPARQNHFALLQVGILEKTVVLVREADLVGFVAALVAHFTDTGHGGKSFVALSFDRVGII
jgi:hypothetical protein